MCSLRDPKNMYHSASPSIRRYGGENELDIGSTVIKLRDWDHYIPFLMMALSVTPALSQHHPVFKALIPGSESRCCKHSCIAKLTLTCCHQLAVHSPRYNTVMEIRQETLNCMFCQPLLSCCNCFSCFCNLLMQYS